MSELYLMCTIVNRRQTRRFQDLYDGAGASLALTTLGRGTAASDILDYFGLAASEKAVLLHVVTDRTWKTIQASLRTQLYIDVPGTGVACTVPISSIGGKKQLQFLLNGQGFEKGEEQTLKETKYELLVVIANQGYTEQIIDGRPLARLSDGFAQYRQAAYAQLTAYASAFNETLSGCEYSRRLRERAMEMAGRTTLRMEDLIDALCEAVARQPRIVTTFSHGDLQPGNIWIENKTNKLFIIDWESWGIRSNWYDKATLFDGLRPGNIQSYLDKEGIPMDEKTVVLLEDLIFQLEEHHSLPGEFGLDKLRRYVEQLADWIDTHFDGRKPAQTVSAKQSEI